MVELITAMGRNATRELIYNQHIMLVNKYDSILFHISSAIYGVDFDITFHFKDDGKKYATSGEIPDGGNTNISIVLHNWYHPMRIENDQPIELNTKNGKKVWIKFGTNADEKFNSRAFYISVWGGEPI